MVCSSMRSTILRMISNDSLSAFSINTPVSGPQPATRAPGAGALQVRAQSPQPPNPGVSLPGGRIAPQSLAPGQIVPRGSLLDVSV